ncbi:hypothetical protein BD413DRAFT_472470 [Trametes elegans]|nr:hypothetical protein BD413DRAFT_472470 [Trametes elegans]
MCFWIVTYTDWACGFRQRTGRHRAECNRWTCRLSYSHRDDEHDCERDCTGCQMDDQHLIMEHNRGVCGECREAGRGVGEHPGGGPNNGANGANGTNGTNGAARYSHVGVPGELDDWPQ